MRGRAKIRRAGMKRVAMGILVVMAAGAAHAQTKPATPATQLWRLDCGSTTIKDFNSFFSDTLEYKSGPRPVVGGCYLIRHGSDYLLWDTGYPASFKGQSVDRGPTVATIRATVAEQLAQLGVKPSDV